MAVIIDERVVGGRPERLGPRGPMLPVHAPKAKRPRWRQILTTGLGFALPGR